MQREQYVMIGLLKIVRKTKRSNLPKPSYQLRDLSDSNAYIDDEKYKDQLRQCFLDASQGKFRSLSMQRNNRSSILKEISHIKLTSLRVLQLSTNFIESIQALEWMNIVNLRVLDLRENFIVHSKPFAKFYTNSLSQLKIGQNLFTSLESLARMKFRVNQGNRDLSLYNCWNKKPYTYVANDLSFLAKLQQPQGLEEQWIRVYDKNRIDVPKLYKTILRKGNKKRSIVLSCKK